MNSSDSLTQTLWIYTQVGVFRFLSRRRWEELYAAVVKQGWDMSDAGDVGWLQSGLNPYPAGAFFSAADARSFALAVQARHGAKTTRSDALAQEILEQVAALFSQGPVLIRSDPPRKTADTGMMEVVYSYSCLTCGFLYSGSWLFSLAELSLGEIRSSVASMLELTYCPLCGSKDIVAITFFLESLDPDETSDFMSWSRQACPGA